MRRRGTETGTERAVGRPRADFGLSRIRDDGRPNNGKWLELLKEIAPGVTRGAVLREKTAIAAGPAQFGALQGSAPSLGVELRPVDVRDAARSSAPSQRSRRALTVA